MSAVKARLSMTHTLFFSPENFMKATENDAEIRRATRLEKEKQATGL